MTSTIAPGEALQLRDLIAPTEHGVASRILAKTTGGSLTLFAFDAGQALAEHSAPFEAIILVIDGHLSVTIGDKTVAAAAGTIVRLPANVPHAIDAQKLSRMLLTMLREPKQ
jgi:quercetin dioxygenase-like cupin family protein